MDHAGGRNSPSQSHLRHLPLLSGFDTFRCQMAGKQPFPATKSLKSVIFSVFSQQSDVFTPKIVKNEFHLRGKNEVQ